MSALYKRFEIYHLYKRIYSGNQWNIDFRKIHIDTFDSLKNLKDHINSMPNNKNINVKNIDEIDPFYEGYVYKLDYRYEQLETSFEKVQNQEKLLELYKSLITVKK